MLNVETFLDDDSYQYFSLSLSGSPLQQVSADVCLCEEEAAGLGLNSD